MRVTTLRHGQAEYTELLDQIRGDPDLVEAMRLDAESGPDELDVPGTWWSVALVEDDGGRVVPAAWCAARVRGDGKLKCHSNYEVRRWRGRGLYEAVYHERHRTVVEPSGRSAVTYLFPEPLDLHKRDDWYWTGRSGRGRIEGHKWFELRR